MGEPPMPKLFLRIGADPTQSAQGLTSPFSEEPGQKNTESGVIQLFALNVYQSLLGPNLGNFGASPESPALGFGFCKAMETFWLVRPMMRRCQSRSARRAT